MLEPEIAAFAERTLAFYPDGAARLPVQQQRALYDRYAAAFAPALPPNVAVDHAVWRGEAGHAIALRRYRALDTRRPRGVVLFFHGGGFVLGSLDSHAAITARLAADTGLDVVAVDYRLAPEHRAPAAHDDCLEVTRAALAARLPFPDVVGPVLLAGDSAGGTLAAGVALKLRDERLAGTMRTRERLHGVALVYPMLAREPQQPARDTEAHAPLLSLADVRVFARHYWADAPAPAWTVPLDAARFDGLPPLLAIAVRHDPLRDDARVFAQRVEAAGGRSRFVVLDGLVHGCWRALATSPGVRRLHREVCAFLVESAVAARHSARGG
ncbi:alpha/beta hydrolase [Paraburkholderia kururiensis]|uniref:alpha/beta hydrolase n=1 Tax=Paraburkholderia kururiensis TaxID=984307 RepID=UPI000F872A00|nr:alpha/beta hydrolase [Paraburkholderia kururiensis]